MNSSTRHDVIVIGGGAAGLFCAATAAARGRRVLVLEGSNKPGKKILMSGGGRCNFTNLNCEPGHFQSQNPHFCKSALKRYTPWHFLGLVEKHGVAWVEKGPGQLFAEKSSKEILRVLLAECDAAGVEILLESGIRSVEQDNNWRVDTDHGLFESESLVIASGGLSIPKMGASGFGYEIARQFGLEVLPTRAGLVPFTFTGALHDMMARLSGVSTEATLEANGRSFSENILFTHRGLSGPAALQISSFWEAGDTVMATLLPGLSLEDSLLEAKAERPKQSLKGFLAQHMPKNLVAELQAIFFADCGESSLGELSNKRLASLVEHMSHWALRPAATEGYRTAEVTLGGVNTDGLSSTTMEVKDVPGLYFIGEVLDVTGELGGFNFQWAWASGHAAGEVV